jgi:hypothetical protein
MEKKSVAQRQAELREKRLVAGFRMLGEWVHEEDRELLKKIAKELRVKRWDKIISKRNGFD